MVSHNVGILFERSTKLAGNDISWASSATVVPRTEELIVGHSSDSEEYHQIMRVKYGIDELIATITKEDIQGLPISSLIELYWSLASCRVWSDRLIKLLQQQIALLVDSISPSQAVFFLWAEAMFFNQNTELDIEVNWADHSLLDITNIVFAYSFMKKRSDIVREGRNLLLTRNVSSGHGIRAIGFANYFLGEDLTGNAIIAKHDKPSWRYTFELCLACQGIGGKVNVLPVVEKLFSFDALYKTKGKKILLEIVRPQSVIRDLETGTIVNVDGYTAMSRTMLSEKGYLIIAISTTEWTNLKGKQIGYLKRRIRNCLDKKTILEAPERDFESDMDSSDSDTGSDMSY